MKKIILFSLIILSSMQVLFAQNEYLDLIKEQKFEKVEKSALKDLKKNPGDINANYVLAIVLGKKDYKNFNPQQAYTCIQQAKQQFEAVTDKQELTQLRKMKINKSALNKVHNDILKAAFAQVEDKNTEEAYEQFLQDFPDASDLYKQKALDKTEVIYLRAITDTNSIEAYRDFIANRPVSLATQKAKEKMCKLAFQQAEQDNSKQAYKDFIDNYPQSKEYPIAFKRYKSKQYLAVSPADPWLNYKTILEKNPKGSDVGAAQDSILSIAKRYGDIKALQYGVAHFSGLKRNRAFMYYHDIFTNDGEKATLDIFYRGNEDPLFASLRVTDYDLASLGDSLKLEQGYSEAKFPLFDKYIKQAAPRERAFVALQKMMAKDIEAKQWEAAYDKLRRYAGLFGENNKKIEDLKRLLEAKPDNSVKIVSIGAGVNTVSGGEYMPVLTADDKLMYFCGKSRKDSIGGEDIYVARKENKEWIDPQIIKDLSYSRSNDAPLSVSADGTKLLIFISGKINSAQKTASGGWTRAIPLPPQINSENWQADAMITSDGRALLFTSVKDGGYNLVQTKPYHGAFHYASDIYVSLLNENGEWDEPINLGSVINTPYCERTPFLHPDMKTLYFSSDGHGGLGGLDVYKSTRLADSCWNCWSEPVNLGKEINTESHDWGYKISTDGEKAYFSKGTRGEKTNDIYSLNLPMSMRPGMVATISGKLANKANQAVEAEIVWEDLETGKVMGCSKADPKTGNYFVVLPLGKMYGYYVEKEGYYPMSDNVDLRKNLTPVKVQKDISMLAIQDMIDQGIAVPITNLFFNTNESVILPYSIPELKRVAAIIKSKNLKVEISGHTDNVGDAKKNQTLSENRAAAVKDFLIKEGFDASMLSTKGYGATKPVADNKTEIGRAKNRRVELRIVK